MSFKRFILSIASLSFVGWSAYATDVEFESVPGEFVVQFEEGAEVQALGYNMEAQSERIALIRPSMLMNSDYVIEDLKSQPGVKYAEPNYIYKINRVPNDPQLSQLWGLRNLGQNSPAGRSGVEGIDIGAEKAWDIQTGNPDLVVAVIDTGVDYNLPDLAENMWVNEGEIPGNGIDDDGNGYIDDVHGYDFGNDDGDPMDDHGHGSHCAGTIGAKGDDGSGIVGVAWDVKIMAIKFLSARGGTLEGAVKSVDYATKMGADIMSNSWGGGPSSDILREAIERAHDAGILFVAAAGNDGRNNDKVPTYPSSYEVPNVLSVAAIDNKGNLASFSNFGAESVDIAAPGVSILSSTPGGYKAWSGTSMATPHVSGIAALLLSNESDLSPEWIIERLMLRSRPLASLRGRVVSGGLANAYHALSDTDAPADPNDPTDWDSQDFSYETAHPYASNTVEEFEVHVPGANEISLHFSRFETEKTYDKLTFYVNGKKVATMSGKLGNSIYSPIIKGDRVTVKFTSDRSQEGFGFSVDSVSYR